MGVLIRRREWQGTVHTLKRPTTSLLGITSAYKEDLEGIETYFGKSITMVEDNDNDLYNLVYLRPLFVCLFVCLSIVTDLIEL